MIRALKHLVTKFPEKRSIAVELEYFRKRKNRMRYCGYRAIVIAKIGPS